MARYIIMREHGKIMRKVRVPSVKLEFSDADLTDLVGIMNDPAVREFAEYRGYLQLFTEALEKINKK